MALDGVCDHTALIADDELHNHYNDLLGNAGALLYGRITYQLMENSWPAIVKNPTGNKPMDDFAVLMQNIPKVVFSHTLKNVTWENSRLAIGSFEEEIAALKHQPGRDIIVGSRSLIITALNLNLVDEFQLSVQPIIAGKGLQLFDKITDRIHLKLVKTKTFGSGTITFYYTPVNTAR